MPLWICLIALAWALPASADDWYPSKYGADDRLGALNNLSPAKVLQAAQLIKTGKSYALGVETGPDTPAYGTRKYQISTILAMVPGTGAVMGTNKTTSHDDLLIAWLGVGSQLDGLGHLGIDHRYYNGVRGADFLRPDGLAEFGTHTLPPIVTRGVLLDVARLKGVERLAAGTAINRADIDAAAKAQGVAIGTGDVVLFHTGHQALSGQDPAQFLAGEPGLGKEGAQYLAEKGVVAIGADTWGVEVIPHEDPAEAYPVHQVLLAKNGVYILENMETAELAADRAYEFMFTLGQPKFVGAVQMVINPVAIR